MFKMEIVMVDSSPCWITNHSTGLGESGIILQIRMVIAIAAARDEGQRDTWNLFYKVFFVN
jgi:hypothetical protein